MPILRKFTFSGHFRTWVEKFGEEIFETSESSESSELEEDKKWESKSSRIPESSELEEDKKWESKSSRNLCISVGSCKHRFHCAIL